MKRFSTKGSLLFVAAMAVCAFAVSSTASASSWGIVGTEHTLDSPNFGYSATTGTGSLTSTCGETTFTVDVLNAAVVTITQVNFRRCTGVGEVYGRCTVTRRPTNLPWRVTAINTGEIELHDMHYDDFFEDHPDTPNGCALKGFTNTVTGTVRSASWSGNGVNQHEILFNNDPGLEIHLLGSRSPATTTGTLRDTQQTLTVTG
jgi:hypothetical protein